MNPYYKSLTILLAGLLLGVLLAGPVYAQDPRPPTDGAGGGTTSGNGGGGNGQNGGTAACAAIKGQVLSWGQGGLGEIGVVLKTGSWQVDTASASDGNYGFGGLGVGIARLQLTLPPAEVGLREPLVQDAAVYLSCDHPVIANLAVYSGPRPTPPASIQLSAPANLMPGQNTVLRLVVKNSLPTDITNVIVTNLMPPGLTAVEATAAENSRSSVQIINGGPDGQLVYAYLDRMPSGAEENFLITVAASPDLATGSQVRNTASLFYAESAGDQDWIDFTVGAGGLIVPAAEETATPIVQAEAATPPPAATAPAAAPAATPEADQGEEFVPPPVMPKTGEEFFPPPSLLPETGTDFLAIPTTLPETGAGDWLALLGFGLGGAAFTLHQFRIYWRNRQ